MTSASGHAGIELFTYDVFDTCVIRNVYRPTHIHWLVARRMTPTALLCTDADDWLRLRVRSESACRALIGEREILLDDIYAEIGRRRAIPGDVLASAQRTETELELHAVRPNEFLRATVEAESRLHATAYVSDSYLPRAVLEHMLERCGFPAATMFVSSEKQRTKRDGGLFQVVSQAESVPPAAIMHMGDNRISDVVRAQAAGVRARHYNQGGFTRFESQLYEGGGRDDRASRIAGAARAGRLSRSFHSGVDEIVWRIGCDVAGPILTAFVLWVVLKAVSEERKRIYFLARDGQILAKIADAIIAWGHFDVRAIYMLASRQALHTASLPVDGAAAIAEILKRGQSKTVGEILRELEIPDDEQSEILHGTGLLPSSAIAMQVEAMGAVLGRRREQIEEFIGRRNSAFRRYLASIGFTGSAEEVLVDLGWHGNLQARIYRVVPEAAGKVPGYYFSLRSFPKQIEGMQSLFLSYSHKINSNILETFCMATHGSVVGIEHGEQGALTTLTRPFGEDGPKLWTVAHEQTAILTFTSELLRAFPQEETDADALLNALTRAGIASFEEFRAAPDHAEAIAYGSVVHASDQSHVGDDELAARLSWLDVLTRSSRYRRATRYWRYGVLFRSLPPWAVSAYQSIRRVSRAADSPVKTKNKLRSAMRRLTGA